MASYATFASPFDVIREFIIWAEMEETQVAHSDADEGELFHHFADEVGMSPDDRHDVAEIMFHAESGLVVPFE